MTLDLKQARASCTWRVVAIESKERQESDAFRMQQAVLVSTAGSRLGCLGYREFGHDMKQTTLGGLRESLYVDFDTAHVREA